MPILARMLPLVLLGCHPDRGAAEPERLPCAGSSSKCIELSQDNPAQHDEPTQVAPDRGAAEPERLPCAGSSSKCIELSQELPAHYDEAAQVMRESPGFCGAMISTFPLAVASGVLRNFEIVGHLVEVCHERGQLPKSEFEACRQAMLAADNAPVAAFTDYKQVAMQRLREMSDEQARQFRRALSSALKGQRPEKNAGCLAPGGAEVPRPDGPRAAQPVASPIGK